MTSDPIDLYANLNLNEIKAEFIQEKELIVEDTPELKELQNDFDVLKKHEAWNEALKCIDKVLKIKQNNPSALFNKGTVLMRLERWEEALECYDKKIMTVQDDIETWANKSLCMSRILLKSRIDPKNDQAIIKRYMKNYNFIKKMLHSMNMILELLLKEEKASGKPQPIEYAYLSMASMVVIISEKLVFTKAGHNSQDREVLEKLEENEEDLDGLMEAFKILLDKVDENKDELHHGSLSRQVREEMEEIRKSFNHLFQKYQSVISILSNEIEKNGN